MYSWLSVSLTFTSLIASNTVTCRAFLLSSRMPVHSVSFRTQQLDNLPASWSSDEAEQHASSLPYVGEGALRYPSLARKIRKNRANRGRIETNHRPMKKKHARNSKKRSAEKKSDTPINRHASNNGSDLPYESAIKVLRVYHSKHSNLVIPRRYIVPVDDAYPIEWHGVDLSRAVYNMRWWLRHVKQNPDRVEELNKLGFIWERLQPEWNLVMEALITYLSLNGDLLVPTKFVVPHGSEHYPKATWGIPLGNCVFRIRTRHDFLRGEKAESRRSQLDGLGFVWDVTDHLFRRFHFALRHYRKLDVNQAEEGTRGPRRALRVPSNFVVPSGEEKGWPRELWGYRLGEKCTAVRQKELYIKDDPERQRALAELGFQWSGNATLAWLEVVHAAAIYSKMNNRNLDVPSNFVVPAPPHIEHDSNESQDTSITGSDDAWPWPERLWGLPLGQRLKDIRLKGAYLSGSSGPARRAQLDALGFVWTPKRGRRKRSTVESQ